MAKASEHRASELRKMSSEQLALELKETADKFFRLRLLSQTERLDAPSELRRHRGLIARIKTVQRERELAAVVAAAQKAE
jgi:large subunit ribosomal protein L29